MGVVCNTAQLPWFWSGLGVVPGLGPGLARESAAADVLAFERSAGRPGIFPELLTFVT
jgi:hypothetical protein